MLSHLTCFARTILDSLPVDLVHALSDWDAPPLPCEQISAVQTPRSENIEQLKIVDAMKKIGTVKISVLMIGWLSNKK
jgi:hypothetical protein